MGFWIYVFCFTLLTPLLLIGVGSYFRKKPPQRINSVWGYRSARSMQNADTWAFAHAYCGRAWQRCGAGALPITVLGMLCVAGKDVGTVGTVGVILAGIQLLLLIGSVFLTESALRKTFDQNGKKRTPPPIQT